MAIWSRFERLFFPLINKRVEREMEEAQHELLSALNHLDYYQAMVTYQRARLLRLKQGDPR